MAASETDFASPHNGLLCMPCWPVCTGNRSSFEVEGGLFQFGFSVSLKTFARDYQAGPALHFYTDFSNAHALLYCFPMVGPICPDLALGRRVRTVGGSPEIENQLRRYG